MYGYVLGALIALVTTAAAVAQGIPGLMPGGVPPAVRPAVVEAHVQAKAAVLADLRPGHLERVRGIVDAFDAGTIATAQDAARQIDDVLSPSERRAIVAERARMRRTLQRGRASLRPDAGRFVLAVAANPGALHGLRPTPISITN